MGFSFVPKINRALTAKRSANHFREPPKVVRNKPGDQKCHLLRQPPTKQFGEQQQRIPTTTIFILLAPCRQLYQRSGLKT